MHVTTMAPVVMVLVMSALLASCGQERAASTAPTSTPGRRLVTLAGTVADADSGAGIGGATVTILSSLGTTVAAEDIGRTTTTDGAGGYRFENITPGNANLSATARGYQERRNGLNVDGIRTLDLPLRRLPTPEVFSGATEWILPFTMRRSGAIDVVVTWEGATDNALAVLVTHEIFGQVRDARPASGSNRVLSFTQTAFWAGNWTIRVVDARFAGAPPPGTTPIPVTLSLTRWD